MNEEQLRAVLEEFVRELNEILAQLKEEKPATTLNEKVFFDSVRPMFGNRLSQSHVNGMKAKIKAFKEAGFPLSWAAYGLATSYHETAKRMQPVREGLNASDAWRKKNLRYYPHYGRGDVQLTWEANYRRADKELGLNGELIKNLDLALDPDISARIMVHGMKDGWFSGDRKGRHTLARYLPSDRTATHAQFKQARRIINLMDKADLIAGYADKFQEALMKAEY